MGITGTIQFLHQKDFGKKQFRNTIWDMLNTKDFLMILKKEIPACL